MLVFWDAGLVLLATPKTGTHALEEALKESADLAFLHPPRIKHMTHAWACQVLPRIVGPKEWGRFRTVAVMREPLDWLGSWYRYRTRDDLRGAENSTRGYSFSEFLRGYMAPEQPPHARLGRQWRFFRDANDGVGVDHLFAYEDFAKLVDFLQTRLERSIALERLNVSPDAPLDVDPGLIPQLTSHLEKDFRLHGALTTGGDWKAV